MQLRSVIEAEYDLERCDAKELDLQVRCFPVPLYVVETLDDGS